MAPNRQGRSITLVGASGNIGVPTLNRLLSHKIHNISVIARPESTYQYPPEVTVKRGSGSDLAFLTEALQGQHVLVLMLPVPALGTQDTYIRAAAAAGVPYVLPTEWGSDPSARLVDFLPLIRQKREPRRLIEDLGVSGWIAFVNNPWYEYCIPSGLLGLDIKARKATIWDDGTTKFCSTTLRRAGQATAELLAMPDDKLLFYRNSSFYVSSFHISQRDMIAAAVRATGTTEADWDITTVPSQQVIDEALAKLKEGDQMAAFIAFPPLHFQKGMGGDFTEKIRDLSALDLDEDDLDEVTAGVVRSIGSS